MRFPFRRRWQRDQLPIRRIAITTPPAGWFHGIARVLHDHYRQALVDLGLTVFDVPVDAFLPPDAVRTPTLLAELRAFKPDFAVGLPHGSYALLCRMAARRDGWRPNLFTEILDVPTICLWDHAPVELAEQLLAPHPPNPAASAPGASAALRRVLTHPRLIHWSRDSGQTRIMDELGFLLPGRVIHELPPALPGFRPQEASAAPGNGDKPSVGFVGHFYQEPPAHPHPSLAALAEAAIQAWLDAPADAPLWNALRREITLLPADLRRELALDLDQTYFWPFAHRLIVHQAQTSSRLKMLGSVSTQVACYGNLRTDLPGVPENLVPVVGHIPFGAPLAAALSRHAITIDVLNPGYVHGCSHKPMLGFATGGFLLINRKQDFVDAFGEAGEAVSYDRADDLAAKVDRFLGDPRYRREVGEAVRETIAARYQLKDVLARVLRAAFQCVEGMDAVPNRPPASASDLQATTVMDVLPEIRCEPHWLGASVQHVAGGALISTAPQAWAYAASIAIPPLVSAMKEPHLRVRILVEAGRVGLAALRDDTGALVAEQLVSPAGRPVTVTVELPRHGSTAVILRNAADTASRALLLEAVLCDRTS